ncbi:MAG: hypothetical protein QOH93_661 [Chloroflexia bacterium]|jgi:hypothetical protein|nr:hypothetical protein [Chloroflexia bacterium]
MTPEELAAKLLDPTYTAPNIYLVIEYYQLYFRPLSSGAKQRLAGGLSIVAPMLGELLRLMQGRATLDWGTLAQLVTVLANFLGSKAIHDLLDAGAARRQPVESVERVAVPEAPVTEEARTEMVALGPKDVQAQLAQLEGGK